MSNDATDKTTMAPEDVLFSRVFVPEFVKACATRGHEITSEEDLGEMMKIATMLRSQEAVVPQADAPSLIKHASASLEAMLYGEQSLTAEYANDPEVAQALQIAQG